MQSGRRRGAEKEKALSEMIVLGALLLVGVSVWALAVALVTLLNRRRRF